MELLIIIGSASIDTGICSCTTATTDDSTINRGVCARDGTFDEFLDAGLELREFRKSSIGISSDRGRGKRGLLSRDRDDDDRFFDESRDFSPLKVAHNTKETH